MLVLSLPKHGSIIINDNITVSIVRIGVDAVRIGIDAPKEIPIHRQEVFDAIKKETKQENYVQLKLKPAMHNKGGGIYGELRSTGPKYKPTPYFHTAVITLAILSVISAIIIAVKILPI